MPAMIVASNDPTFNVKFLNQISRGNLFLWLCITKTWREYLPNKRTWWILWMEEWWRKWRCNMFLWQWWLQFKGEIGQMDQEWGLRWDYWVRKKIFPSPSYFFFSFLATIPPFMTGSSRLNPSEIVGGQPAPSPIPWQVSVQKLGLHFCGATILDEFTLLSAAHCFDDDGKSDNSTDGKFIRAGSTKKSSGGQVCMIYKIVN